MRQSSSDMEPNWVFLIAVLALLRTGGTQFPGRCTCDSTVYEYCSGKLFHDACCCLDPYEYHLPAECKLADCSFLHANTCRDHHLITRCCCNRLLTGKKL